MSRKESLYSVCRSIWPPVVAALFFLLVWQIATIFLHVEPWMLPSPADIAVAAADQFTPLAEHTWATVKLTLGGFAIGTAVGLLLAVLLHLLPWLKRALYPLLILSQNIPTIALGPLLMIWFGFGLLPKLMVITLVCFFPVVVAALDGLTQTDRSMMNYMQMSGANRMRIFRKLELPHALPALFSGMKIAAAYSVMGAIVAEWLGASEGIGYYMLLQKSAYHTDRVFAAIAIIVVFSLVMFLMIALLERRLVQWRSAQPQTANRPDHQNAYATEGE